jgi:atypical dual specificity phosphatase
MFNWGSPVAKLYEYLSYGTASGVRSVVRSLSSIRYGGYICHDPGARVVDGVYIGSLATATSERFLDENDISTIINLSGCTYRSSRTVHHIHMDDVSITPLSIEQYVLKFTAGVELVERARAASENVLVHCAAGVNRSAALIGFYLIDSNYSYDEAIELLTAANSRRGLVVLSNPSFRVLLHSFYLFVGKQ